MKIVIDIPKKTYNEIKERTIITCGEIFAKNLARRIRNGTPLPKHLNKIKDDIGKYELDCRFADYSQTDECAICNKNVFESIYRIIDKYIEGSDSE